MRTIAVGGLLVSEDRVLLGKRAPTRRVFPGVWDVPGGHGEDEETPEETLVRELAEELGIVPVEYRELAVLPPITEDPLPFHLYCVTRWSGTPRNLQTEEHTEIAWVELDEVDELELALPTYPSLFRSVRDHSRP
jgi:8-oxo-dGTP diphosphatase